MQQDQHDSTLYQVVTDQIGRVHVADATRGTIISTHCGAGAREAAQAEAWGRALADLVPDAFQRR
jgi:hypothetical protein